MKERMARIHENGHVLMLTVFAEDGDLVAFKYDKGGYGWANRSSFISEAEANQLIREFEAKRELDYADTESRVRAAYRKRIVEAQAVVDRLYGEYARHVADLRIEWHDVRIQEPEEMQE